MDARIEVIGVYPVRGAKQLVSLVELWIRDYFGIVDFGNFGQNVPEIGVSHNQVAYDEHLLNDEGTSGAALSLDPCSVQGEARVTFFLHFVDCSRPMKTPFGLVPLPQPADLPARLAFIRYSPPD